MASPIIDIDKLTSIFERNIHKPSPTYNDLVLMLRSVNQAITNDCFITVDLKDRLGVLELFDLGSRLDIANAYWDFCDRV